MALSILILLLLLEIGFVYVMMARRISSGDLDLARPENFVEEEDRITPLLIPLSIAILALIVFGRF